MLTIEVITQLGELEALAKPWTDLLRRFPRRNLFLSHEWTVNWWRSFGVGQELRVLLIFDGTELIGIAPMKICRGWLRCMPVRKVGFFSNIHTSRSDFIAPAKEEEVVNAVLGYWGQSQCDWDMIELQRVDVVAIAQIRAAAERCGLADSEPRDDQSLFYLQRIGAWEDYLRSRSTPFRKELRRCEKRLSNYGVVKVSTYTTKRDLAVALPKFWALQSRSWKARDNRAYLDDQIQAFHRQLAEAFVGAGEGYATCFLELNERPIAAAHFLIYEEVAYGFHLLHDEAYANLGPGRILISSFIERMYREGILRAIDFNGDSQFCRSFASTHYRCQYLQLFNRRPYSRLLITFKRLASSMRGVNCQAPRRHSVPMGN